MKKRVHKSQLEIGSKFHKKADVQKARPQKKVKRKAISFKDTKPDKGWMIAGFDTSLSSLAGAAIAYDGILRQMKGPVFAEVRWTKEDHYFDRLKVAAKSHEMLLDLQGELLLSLSLDKIFIAQEEPWPFGMVKGAESGWLKQQAEISGAFIGGLVRYGFQNVSQMNTVRWRKVVAEMISEDTGEDVTTHHSKWRSQKLAKEYNALLKDSGKFRTKQWALDVMAPYFGQQYSPPNEILDWPDIIESGKLGKIPRPDDSKARSVQPEDCYDALAVCWTHFLELQESGLIEIDE